MRAMAAPRWAIGFADLGLLLLGCFVMLHAMESARPRADAGTVQTRGTLRLAAAELFEPGEARFTAAGKALVGKAARANGTGGAKIVSRGAGEASTRLDAFELAAARAAAMARALAAEGMNRGRITLSLDAAGDGAGQTIEIVPAP